MSDIEIKLRQAAVDRAEDLRIAAYGPGGGDPDIMPGEMLSWKAADEISRLRQENERLREALRGILWAKDHFRKHGSLVWEMCAEKEDIARRALEE